jgi:hypothetical protein
LFLPFFVFESMLHTELTAVFPLAFVMGFVLPLAVFGVTTLVPKIPALARAKHTHFDEFRFSVSTFGGGNRGTALVLLLFAGSENLSSYLKWYALVDLGNFACLLSVMALLLHKRYGYVQVPNSFCAKTKLVLNNYAVITILVVLLLVAVNAAWPDFQARLERYSGERKAVFTMLIFLALTLNFNLSGSARTFAIDIVTLVAVRGAVIAIVLLALASFFPKAIPIAVAAVILLLVPPSSMLPGMMDSSNCGPRCKAYVTAFCVLANIPYYLLVGGALLLALARAL